MARIRSIKPAFFRHELLQELEAEHPGACVMLVFAGLLGHCDKVGVFEYRPRMLKLDILPFLPFDMAETLAILERGGFVERFSTNGKDYGRVLTFVRHQRISGKEAQEPPFLGCLEWEALGKQPGSAREATGTAGREGKGTGKGREQEGKRACARDDSPGQAPEAAPELPPGLDPAAWKRWHDYRREIRKPLKPVSIPAAQRELAAFGCDQSAVVEQSVANGYQGLFELKKRANGSGHAAGKPTRRLRTADEIEAEEASRAEH